MTSARSDLRKMLERGETIVAPGAFDPLTARLVEWLGFPAVYLGGEMTGCHLTTSEPLLTMTEQVAIASRLVQAVKFPVLVDGHAGFGDAVHTMRTVREFENAGIAGIHIEDQVFPKRVSYHSGLSHIVPLEEFLGKMRFALKAREDRDFIIIGRTDAFIAEEGSREEAVRRGKALVEVGVDVLFICGLHKEEAQRENLTFFRNAIPDIPMLVVGGLSPMTVQDYEDLGYQLIIYADTPTGVVIGALLDVYKGLKETGVPTFPLDTLHQNRAFVNELIGMTKMYEIERETTEQKS